ncbi:unnamed protein product [Caenorhabditis nigoni]
MRDRVVQCRFVGGARQGQMVSIPRIKLNYDFIMSRLQFPIRLSFAMTVNKLQGQTFEKIKTIDDCEALWTKTNPRSDFAKWLSGVSLILWDEAPMSPKAALETVDTLFREITQVNRPFGGKVVMLGGDFRQVLPVMDKGGADAQIANCINRSPLWKEFQVFHLTANMRVKGAALEWKKELLDIEKRNIHLHFEEGAIIMLLRNLDVKNSMCNGTRFVVVQMGDRVIQFRFVGGVRQSQMVLIPRIKLNYEKNLPFVMSRLQFPVRLPHGQLYGAFSRTTSREGIKVHAPSGIIHNVVYKEVLL